MGLADRWRCTRDVLGAEGCPGWGPRAARASAAFHGALRSSERPAPSAVMNDETRDSPDTTGVGLPPTPAQDRPRPGSGHDSRSPGGGREESVLVAAPSRADDGPVTEGASRSRSLLRGGRRHAEGDGVCKARYGRAPGTTEEQKGEQRGGTGSWWKVADEISDGRLAECQGPFRAYADPFGPRVSPRGQRQHLPPRGRLYLGKISVTCPMSHFQSVAKPGFEAGCPHAPLPDTLLYRPRCGTFIKGIGSTLSNGCRGGEAL